MIMTLRKFSPFGESPSIVLNPRFRTLFHDASLGRDAHAYSAHLYSLVTMQVGADILQGGGVIPLNAKPNIGCSSGKAI